jgi:hypothetical protein
VLLLSSLYRGVIRGLKVPKPKISEIFFVNYLSNHHNVVDPRRSKLSVDSKDAQERVLYSIVIAYPSESV